MNPNLTRRSRWFVVAAYATAMAWVEAAVVYYLRTMVNRIEPYQPDPLPLIGGLGRAELVREAATLIMLLAVGILAGRSWRARLGFAALAFGIWDILYYVFLKLLCGWPHSLFDWDILFLLPLPWWGPVLAPVLISCLMILWGTLASADSGLPRAPLPECLVWALNFIGILLALSLFMQDTFAVAKQGPEAVRRVLPLHFNWPLFNLALLLLAAPPLLALTRRFSRLQTASARLSATQPPEAVELKSTVFEIATSTPTVHPDLEP